MNEEITTDVAAENTEETCCNCAEGECAEGCCEGADCCSNEAEEETSEEQA